MKYIVAICLVSGILRSVQAQPPRLGMSLWLKADAGLETKGTNIISWKDQSGQNKHATTTSETPPQQVLNELNQLPVVRFNGQDNAIETVPFQTFPNKRGTVIVLVKVKGLGTTSGVGYGTFVSTYYNKGITWQFGSKGPLSIYYDGVGSSGFPIAEMSVGRWCVVALRRDSDSVMQYLRDGTVNFRFRISNNQADLNPLKIGSNGRLEVLNGDIAEIMVYDKALSEEEMNNIYVYLNKKYQLQFQLTEPPQRNWGLYALILLTMGAITIAFTKWKSQSKLKKQLAELERQREIDRERQRISREMHDDIGAGLTQITLMSETARNNDEVFVGDRLSEIAEASRKLVGNMSEIIWSLSPENKSMEHLMAYLREQLNRQLEYSTVNYSIDLPENGKGYVLTNQQRRNILMITREIVNNALKHSAAQHISVKATIKDNQLKFEIKDDGKGFEADKKTKGNGLKNIRARIEELNGHLMIESTEGTRFLYTIPLSTT